MRLSSDTKIIASILFTIVTVEGVLLLEVFGMGHTPLKLHDYRVYHQLAVNIMDHSTFSADDTPPLRPTLFRSPGYPAFIALVYLLGGRSGMALGVAQFVLLWLTAFLLYLLGKRFFSVQVATIAAVFAATYPPFVFMAPLYAAHSLALCLTVAVFLMVVQLRDQPRPSLVLSLFIGLVLGFMTVARPSFILLPFVIGGGLLCECGTSVRKRRLAVVGLLFTGYAIMVTPWVVRNNVVTSGASGTRVMVGGWGVYVSVQQYSGAISYQILKPEWDTLVTEFISRNNAIAQTIPADTPNALALQEIEVERSYVGDSLSQMQNLSIFQVLRSLPPRLFWLWSTSDVSPWQTGIFHRFVQGYHVFLTILGMYGLFLNRRVLLSQWPLWMFVFYETMLHMVFHVEARFTLEARLFLCLYAGVALIQLCSILRARSWITTHETQPAHVA